jgi:hypothetical protein
MLTKLAAVMIPLAVRYEKPVNSSLSHLSDRVQGATFKLYRI